MTTPKSSDWAKSTQWYDENPLAYSQRAEALDISPILTDFASKLPHGGRVLDYGCGSGRDMEHFLKLGFDAHGIDGSRPLVDLCANRLNAPERVRHMKFEEFADPEESWDGIWAMASLLHMPRRDLGAHLGFLSRRLRAGGALFACLKTGDKDFIDERGRPMSTLNKQTAQDLLTAHLDTGFLTAVTVSQSSDTLGYDTGWTNIEVSRL